MADTARADSVETASPAPVPRLEVLPLRDLVFHEEVDLARVAALIERLDADGVLRNPPIVARSAALGERRLLVDGANRIEALARMGMAHAVVQTEAEDSGLRLSHWNHVIRRREAEAVAAEPPPGVRVVPVGAGSPEGTPLCRLLRPDGAALRFYPGGASKESGGDRSAERAAALRAVVEHSAHPRARIARVAHADLEEVRRGHPDFGGLMTYPDLLREEIERMALAGERLPSGVTRFLPRRRVLGFDLPLGFLATNLPLAEKRRRFEAIVAERFETGRVRFYAESTIVFDD